MTEDEARDALLSFEGAVEGSHHGHPDFRVRNKIFATLRPGQSRAVLRLPLELAEGLASAHSLRHKVLMRSGKWGWLEVLLGDVGTPEFSDLAATAHASIG
jgi:hypothetical protein